MGPRFLCIGAMRSGTSWLHKNLKAHPGLWLPPVKELHYLDHLGERHRGLPIILRDRSSRRRGRLYLKEQVKRLRRFQAPDGARWAFRYFLWPPSVNWYVSLFPPGPRMPGECTPAYAGISEDAVKLLRKLSPELRIIYLLRNPVHRDWSHAAKLLRNRRTGRTIDTAADPIILRALLAAERTGKSDYMRTVRRWGRHFPAENLFVGFFDELERDPRALLVRILTFLGADASERSLSHAVGRRFARGSYRGIPDRFLAHLSARHYERVAEIHAYFNNPHTRGWLDFASRYRQRSEC